MVAGLAPACCTSFDRILCYRTGLIVFISLSFSTVHLYSSHDEETAILSNFECDKNVNPLPHSNSSMSNSNTDYVAMHIHRITSHENLI